MSLKDRISDWARFQTILSVLARHGFSGLINEVGIPIIRPKNQTDESEISIPKRLRLAFEELGPTFIKLGQLLSTRPDLLPESYIQEFSKLTDRIPSFPFTEVSQILSQEFGRDSSEIYSFIEETPIAAASIAQVHRAKLKETEESVVIKVQRPRIAKTIQGDLQVLYFLARALERVRDDFKLLNLTAIVREFQRSIHEELDFTLEAKNLDRFSENFPAHDGIVLPEVRWDYTTRKILTMTEILGTPLSQIQSFPENVNRPHLTESLVNFFFESMFFHGLFHADAHSGNVLLITEGEGKLGILDFGMVGTLSADLRQKLARIFLAVVSRDFESLAVSYMDIGEFRKNFSLASFQSDVAEFLAPNLGKPLREINIGQLLLDSTKIARKYQIKLPRDLIMFYRSLVVLEHIGRKLDPEFDFLTYGKKFSRSIVQHRFSPEEVTRDLYKIVEGVRLLGTELPAQVKLLIKRMDRDDFPLGSSGLEKTLRHFKQINRQSSLSFLSFSCLLCATLLTALRPDFVLVWPLWIAGASLGAILLLLVILNR